MTGKDAVHLIHGAYITLQTWFMLKLSYVVHRGKKCLHTVNLKHYHVI